MVKTIDIKLGDFEMKGVSAPNSWSDKAISIAARTYFAPGETSVYQMIGRVVNEIQAKGISLGYFDEKESEKFLQGLSSDILNQKFAFNSPVWMNVGVPGRDPQCWACLILGVDDNMQSIQEGWLVESKTFQNGSGSGVNVSKIRANGEPLSGGGVGSGPISLWMRPTDSIANVVRSGGKTRRAAKMVIMDVDHPEILDFIRVKADAEKMARDLLEKGYDISMTGKDSANIPFQQANNSVRITEKFMEALDNNAIWDLKDRTRDNETSVFAVDIWNSIVQAAWECADPGVQFHDTINEWNPVLNDGEITASNPCSEYMFLDNTVCNLASINLRKFQKDGKILWDDLRETVERVITAMDILVDLSSYPTEKIGETSKRYRTLGLGFANLGALLMSIGIAYDSEFGRGLASLIMSDIHMKALETSQKLAKKLGAYPAWENNKEHQTKVIESHVGELIRLYEYQPDLIREFADYDNSRWRFLDPSLPLRNAQVTVIAPTGTIALMMDCETTGIEPVFSLAAEKTLAHGGSLDVGVKDCVSEGIMYLRKNWGVEGSDEDIMANYSQFQTAVGDNPVSPEGHVRMMAAVQPFVSGAISKTCNLPNEATVQDVSHIYRLAYDLGLKAIAVYRDGCKAYQPMNVRKKDGNSNISVEMFDNLDMTTQTIGTRKRPPATRTGVTHKFEIQGQEFYLTVNRYPDGKICEFFIQSNKHGSEISGWVNAFSIACSMALQYGVPIEDLIDKFQRTNFAPQGLVVSESPIKFADSPLDYIMRWINSIQNFENETVQVPSSYISMESENVTLKVSSNATISDPCPICGGKQKWAGTCKLCVDCGGTSGCS